MLSHVQRVEFQVAGITFRPQEEIAQLRPSGICRVEKDIPENIAKHKDQNAIRVFWGDHWIGYVPGPKSKSPEVQALVLGLLKNGRPFSVFVKDYCYKSNAGFNNNHEGVLGAVTLLLEYGGEACRTEKAAPETERPQPFGSAINMLESFNEPGVVVQFDEGAHSYVHNDKPLRSVTRAVAAMYEPFDAAVVAGRCEKSFGMPAKSIMDMWEANGAAASSFGTAMHMYMENYEKYGERALPKIGMLREIVLGFPCYGMKALSEVLVTSVRRGLCGRADRIVIHESKHRVEDFKFNAEVEEESRSGKNRLFPDMPSNKVTKYICQLSIYSEMMEEAGIKMSDYVVAHVWDGKWTSHKHPRIRGVLDKLASDI